MANSRNRIQESPKETALGRRNVAGCFQASKKKPSPTIVVSGVHMANDPSVLCKSNYIGVIKKT